MNLERCIPLNSHALAISFALEQEGHWYPHCKFPCKTFEEGTLYLLPAPTMQFHITNLNITCKPSKYVSILESQWPCKFKKQSFLFVLRSRPLLLQIVLFSSFLYLLEVNTGESKKKNEPNNINAGDECKSKNRYLKCRTKEEKCSLQERYTKWMKIHTMASTYI